MPLNTWTLEKIVLLKKLFPKNHKKDIMRAIPGSWGNIRKKANYLNLIRDPQIINEDRLKRKLRNDGLQSDEIILLKKIYENNSKEDILKQINRSWNLISKNARKLNLKRDSDLINKDRKKRGPRKDSYSQKELDLIVDIYENNKKEFILDQFKKAGFKRSWQSIKLTAISLNIKRKQEIIKQEMINGGSQILCPPCETLWTKKENELLKTIYRNNSREYLLSQFPKRTWRAIHEHALTLELLRSNQIIEKDRKKELKKNLGIDSTWQLESVKEKSRQTNLKERGVEYPTQSAEVREKVKETVQKRYGVDNVFQSEKIKEKIEQTNIEKYGSPFPNQNEKVRKKTYETSKLNNSFSSSDEEDHFYHYLILYDPNVEHHVLHPVIRHTIDFYMPRYNLWVQYDGAYWHGKEKRENDESPRAKKIKVNIKNDNFQNNNIPNLIRFWSDDIKKAEKNGTILDLVKKKIDKKGSITLTCHQYRKKLQWFEEDKKNLNLPPLKATSFTLTQEKFNNEIVDFIKRYEWLGTIGVTPKWCFTARYKGLLGGVLLINEPTSYSKILGENTMVYEALIQRGATASWTPKNLGSRFIMFACKWMIQNTYKRAFIGYADPKALEIGTIYQACGFDYLGNNFGSSYLYRHPRIKDNKTFSAQSLKRTSAFKRWCKQQDITAPKKWFKENGFKNLKTIPEGVKNQWNNWNKKILSEAQKFITERKHKYILIKGKNRKEQKNLNKLKFFLPKPYPKRNEIYSSDNIKDPNTTFPLKEISDSKHHSFSTKSRRTPEKAQYIIENYKNRTQKELAETLNETERWVQSQIRFLQKEGKLATKNPVGSTKSRKSEKKLQFIIDNLSKLTRIEMATVLKESPRWIKRQITSLNKI